MIKVIDVPLSWTRRHRDATLLIVLAISCLVLGIGIHTNRDQASVAASQARVAKSQAQATKSLAQTDSKRIDQLFTQRDERRHALDVSRYHAALAGCARQNVARAGTNAIAVILIQAFAPVIAAEKKGKVDTPLVRSLALAAEKLSILPLTKCKKAIPNPDAPQKKPAHQ